MATEITRDNFETEVLQSDLPVVAFFQLPNCAKCVVFKSFAESMEKKGSGKLKLAVFNIMNTQSLVKTLKVSSTPGFVLYNQGREVDRFFGDRLVKDDIEKAIDTFLQ